MKIRNFLFLLLIAYPPLCSAGVTDYYAFDFNRCVRWWFDLDGWPPDGYKRYDPNAGQEQGYYWTPVFATKGDNTRVAGLCKVDYSKKAWPDVLIVYCEKKDGFPLSGATFAAAKDGINSVCIKGCREGVPKWIYLEPNEVRGNVRYAKADQLYRQKCERTEQ